MNNKIEYIRLPEVRSTNTYVSEHSSELCDKTVVYADAQTSGRGQRGNTWESEPGKNVTMSIFLRAPKVLPAQQFYLSEACALAVVVVLGRYIDEVSIKWPNDIYYKDKKICGILIEHSLSAGKIAHTIAGIGLNVNQRAFLSEAPNPVSIYQILGRECDIRTIVEEIAEAYIMLCEELPDAAESLHENFLQNLYRKTGLFKYKAMIDSKSDRGEIVPCGVEFSAEIVDVQPDGMLLLRTSSDAIHKFAFKEVMFVI